MKKKIMKSTAALLALSVIGTLGISYKVSSILTNPKRLPLVSNPKAKLDLDYEDVEFNSGDNKLKGWYVPSNKNRFTLIYSHGYGQNRECIDYDAYDIMELAHKMGGNFLSFDFSAEGESEGKMVTVGYREQEDLKSAIKFAKEQSNSPIVLHGISMGAATTTLVASYSEDIVGSIVDSPFSNLRDYLEDNLTVWTKLPKKPFQPVIMAMEEGLAGISMDKVNPIDSVKNLKTPMLIMHGKGDDVIPYTESERIAANNREKIELKIMENKGHCMSLKILKKEYLKNFEEFLNKVI